MKKIIAFLITLTLCFSICSCGKNVEKDIQGTWEYSWYAYAVDLNCTSRYEFDDGSVTKTSIRGDSVTTTEGTYTITENEIEIHLEGYTTKLTYSYKGGKLSLVYYGDGTVENVYEKIK